MLAGTGLDSQFGFVKEVDYGTPVVVTRFLEYQDEGIETQYMTEESFGLGAGRFLRASHVNQTVIGAAGPLKFHVMTHGFGLMFEQLLGAIASTQVGVTAEWVHSATPDLSALRGIASTMQIGRPETAAGTVHPFTFPGCKVTSFELSNQRGQPLMLTIEVNANDVDTVTALAVASFASARRPLFSSDTNALTLGGTTVFSPSVSVKVENALDAERYGLTSLLKREPLGSGPLLVTCELDAEFESMAHYNAIVGNTIQQLIWDVQGPVIPTTPNPFKLLTTLDDLHLRGNSPLVTGPGIVRQKLTGKALYDGTNPVIQIDYHTDDAAP